MRFLVMCVVVVPACFPETSGDGLFEPRELTVNWSLKGPGDAPVGCPAGFDTLQIDAAEDVSDIPSYGFIERVPCATTGTHTYTLYIKGAREVEPSSAATRSAGSPCTTSGSASPTTPASSC